MAEAPDPGRLNLAEFMEMLGLLRDITATATDEQLAFFGFCLRNIGWSHSQQLQDLWVAYELKSLRDGFFVEFGATNGLMHSNSLGLERHLGWRGILAEPARTWHEALRANRRCAIDTRCVWTQTGERLLFNQTPLRALSTIDRFSASDLNAAQREAGERYDVETVSLVDLLRTWDAPRRIDYLSVDTEGSELEILRAFDWSAYDVRLITVEHAWSAQRQPLFDLLTAKGFRRKFEGLSRADDWYVKAD